MEYWKKFSIWFFGIVFGITLEEIFLTIIFKTSIIEMINTSQGINLWGLYSLALVISFILFVCVLISLVIKFFKNKK